MELVQDAGNLQANPSDQFTLRDLNDHAKSVQEKVRPTATDAFDVACLMFLIVAAIRFRVIYKLVKVGIVDVVAVMHLFFFKLAINVILFEFSDKNIFVFKF